MFLTFKIVQFSEILRSLHVKRYSMNINWCVIGNKHNSRIHLCIPRDYFKINNDDNRKYTL